MRGEAGEEPQGTGPKGALPKKSFFLAQQSLLIQEGFNNPGVWLSAYVLLGKQIEAHLHENPITDVML